MNPSQTKNSASSLNLTCDWIRREQLLLASYAMFSKDSRGRKYAEPPHAYRSPFQRDRDRILHSAAFRRLSGKMQVFTGEMGDYHRTRLTHTHEVATIARTIARVLRLNEDLIEALALVHDIGHPPFGHSGEDALNVCFADQGGFSHNRFALTLVEELETRYTIFPGLNLSLEVLEGQGFRISHAGETPLLEVQVVDLADSLAYTAHDVDDALALGLISLAQLQGLELVRRASQFDGRQASTLTQQTQRNALVHSLIDVQVADVLETAQERLSEVRQLDSLSVRQLGVQLELSPILASEREQLAQFLFEHVYRHPQLTAVRERAAQRVSRLVQRLVSRPQCLPDRWLDRAQRCGTQAAVRDYIAGMTDRFCDARYRELIELGENKALDW